MTDIDQLSRRMSDIEYRVRQLEKASEPRSWGTNQMPTMKPRFTAGMTVQTMTWCDCGREHCRAPDCPSHKPDPMGR